MSQPRKPSNGRGSRPAAPRPKKPTTPGATELLRSTGRMIKVPVAPPSTSRPSDANPSDAQRRFDELRDIAASFSAGVDLRDILDRVVDGILRVAGCERGHVILFDTDGSWAAYTGRWSDRRAWEQEEARQISHTVVDHVLKTRQPFIAADTQKIDRLKASSSIQEGKTMSVACLPLLADDGLLGVIYADSQFVRRELVDEDRGILQVFGVMAAHAVENARRHGELKERGDRLEEQNLSLARHLASEFALEGMISKSKVMLSVFEFVLTVAKSNLPVLILGESGTGKEVIARAIHKKSARAGRQFHAVNTASIPHDLVESTLFGHAKGSFSGAVSDQPGVFEVANGGTVFLDEIGEMPLDLQPKLLRVLQEKEFERVGEPGRVRTTDVRIVSATNLDIERAVDDGDFRSDLFFRLRGAMFELPALRSRREDIIPLAKHFLSVYATENSQTPAQLSADARALLLNHSWPGNVRELKSVIEGGVLFQDDGHVVHGAALERFMKRPRGGVPSRRFDGTLRQLIDDFEEQVLRHSLEEHGGNVTNVSKAVGLSRQQLYNKFRKYGISVRSE